MRRYRLIGKPRRWQYAQLILRITCRTLPNETDTYFVFDQENIFLLENLDFDLYVKNNPISKTFGNLENGKIRVNKQKS